VAKRELPSPELLRQLLDYDADIGALTWRYRTQALAANFRSWNKQYAGKRADKRPCSGTALKKGYLRVLIYDHPYQAHRVAWAVANGVWPDGQIDHINGCGADNRLCNLRVVNDRENRRNTALHGRNKSGVSGVRRRMDRKSERWVARIYVDGKTISLGTFPSFAEAVTARKAAESQYGFHQNHGRPRSGSGNGT
jgi:hypothetical protein